MTHQKRHQELSDIIRQAQHLYHTSGESQLDDTQYDALLRELATIEMEHPELASGLTHNIGASEVGLGGTMRRHPTPMQSLDNAFDEQDMERFKQSFSRKLHITATDDPKGGYTIEYKLDGLSANIYYKDGKLQWAATRGDGTEGEDITAQMRLMGIPESINVTEPIEIRGEIYMPRSVLTQHNQDIANGSKQGKPFANCRNAAVGSLRKGTPERVGMLRFIVWGAGLNSHHSQEAFLQWAAGQGFNTEKMTVKLDTLQEAVDQHSYLESLLPNQDFDADGSVIKLNDFRLQDEAGKNSRAPAWAIAWKFKGQQVTTPLKDVIFTTGRTGKITPVAELTPVHLDGSTVSRATLNNADFLEGLDLHEGDTVILQKAGGVIPEVIGVVRELRPRGARKVKIPDTCPSCHQPTSREEGEASTFCRNPECPSQAEARLRYVASADVLDIQGLGPSITEALFQRGMRHFHELYQLTVEDLASLPVSAGLDADGVAKPPRALGEKTASKLIREIESSKTTDLWRFIRALGIPMAGKGTGTRLARVYPTLQALRDTATREGGEAELASIRDIGKLTAANICQYFRKHGDVIDHLIQSGVDPKPSEQLQEGGALSGMTIVVTGTLSHSRSEVENWLRKHSADVTGSVTRKTTHLLAGEKSGSKLDKAQELGIQILSQDEMQRLCQERGLSFMDQNTAPAESASAESASGPQIGVNTSDPATPATPASQQPVPRDLSDLKVVLTGVFEQPRSQVEAWLAQQGAMVAGSISRGLTHVVAGEKAGSKVNKAHSLQIPVISEQELRTMCQERGIKWLG